MKLLKSLYAAHFTVELFESDNGQYYVIVDHDMQSAPIADYALASFMFDAAIAELEGN